MIHQFFGPEGSDFGPICWFSNKFLLSETDMIRFIVTKTLELVIKEQVLKSALAG